MQRPAFAELLATLSRNNPELPGLVAQARSVRLIERLVELPPTDLLQHKRDAAAERVAALVALAEKDRDAVNPRKLEVARAELGRFDEIIADALERDRLQLGRPDGCFCLGQGGRLKTVVGISVSNGTDKPNVYAVEDPAGGPLMGYREYCGCPDGQAFWARVKAIVAPVRANRKLQVAAGAWGQMGIPQRFHTATVPSWAERARAMGDDPAATLEELDQWRRSGSWLVLWGEPGRGKTGLLAALVRELVDRGHSALFRTVPDLLARLRQTYSGDGKERALMQALIDIEVLVLDDLGADRSSDWAQETLFRLLNQRYDDQRKTLLSSNLDPNALAAHLTERTFDRVRQMAGRSGYIALRGSNLRDAEAAA